jgi:hypothetical protein
MEPSESCFDYLRVEPFMADPIKARALLTALETGLIDQLKVNGSSDFSETPSRFKGDEKALKVLLRLLMDNGVIERNDGRLGLTDGFLAALSYRDILERKLSFGAFVLPDLGDLFTALIADPQSFARRARIFGLFAYDRCFDDTAENRERTGRWMAITTVLSRYEAAVCAEQYDFSHHKRMLDIGGNSGEFLLRLCRRHESLSGVVLDLPLVCRIGKEHLSQEVEMPRIGFLEANALLDPIPRGFDLVSFKSMLHDWPEKEATQLLTRAVEALEQGGTVMVFERGPIETALCPLTFSTLPFLLFFRSFREAEWYEERMVKLGLQDVRTVKLQLDTPFHLVTGRKRA